MAICRNRRRTQVEKFVIKALHSHDEWTLHACQIIAYGYEAKIRFSKTSTSKFWIGTPVQNNLAELWSLLNFLMPKLFDDQQEFLEYFKDINFKSKEVQHITFLGS